MERLRVLKAIVMEPRSSDKENFDDVMRQFYEIVKNCVANGVFIVLVAFSYTATICVRIFDVISVTL